MTNREAISFFKTFAVDSTGFVPDDYGFSSIAILQLLHNNRARVIKEAIDKRMTLSHQTIQTLACISLEEADMIEDLKQERSDCVWLRSIEPVPTSITTFSVTSTIGSTNFDYVEWDKLRHKMNSRSSSIRNGKYWTYRDTGDGVRLYILNTEWLESVAQNAVYENPILADQFSKCGVTDQHKMCNPLDLDFHTQEDLIERIMTKTIAEYHQRLRLMGADIISDDTDNTRGVGNAKA